MLYGSITGNVTDKTGLPLPSAKAEALDTETGVTKQTVTDQRGSFVFNDLQPGLYRVTVSANGFASVAQNNIRIEANTQKRVDIALDVSQLNQSVTVDASAVTLQADRVEVNTQIFDKEVEDLPLTGARNFQSLLDLVPGITPPAASHSEAGNPTGALATNVNRANRASYNNNGTRIDGAVNGYPWLPEIIAYVPPAESIQAVSVSTGNYDAEQGMAGGSLGIQHHQQAQRQELLLSRRTRSSEVHQQPVRPDVGRAHPQEQAILLRRLGANHEAAGGQWH